MKYIKRYTENISTRNFDRELRELNGDITIDDIEIFFIDLIDNNIISKLDVHSIVDHYSKYKKLTVYINIFGIKDIDVFTEYRDNRFKELMSEFFINYTLLKILPHLQIDPISFETIYTNILKFESKIPLVI